MNLIAGKFIALCLLLALSSLQALAGEVHVNQLEIKREGKEKFVLVFNLNLPQVLHQLLAPQASFPEFLKSYSEMPEIEFQKAIDKGAAKLSESSFFLLPSGARMNFKKWQLPANQAMREAFKANAFLLNFPAGPLSHLPPVPVLAEAQSKTPVSRVQIELSKAFNPIFVKVKADQFWLTEQIPLAIINLE